VKFPGLLTSSSPASLSSSDDFEIGSSYSFDSVGGSFGVSGRAQEKLLLSNGCDLVTPDFFQQLPAQQLQQLGEVRGYAPRLVALPGLSWDIEWQTCDENRNSAGA
jgi:hypothetical protein